MNKGKMKGQGESLALDATVAITLPERAVPRGLALLPANIHKLHVLAVRKVKVCHVGIRGSVSVYCRCVVAVAAVDGIAGNDTVDRVEGVVAGRAEQIVSARAAYNSVVALCTKEIVVSIAAFLKIIAAAADEDATATVAARSTQLGVVASAAV